MTELPAQESFEQIAALLDGQLSPAEQATLRARVLADPQSTTTLAWLERVVGLMRADIGFDAPTQTQERAVALLKRETLRLPVLRPRTRIASTLRFDSRTQPIPYGFRSGLATTRQLLFNAGERDIDLRVTPGGGGFIVAGQILGPEQPGTVTLRGEAATVETALNELAEFVLPPVPAGNYTLILTLESAEIAVDDLNI